MATSLNASLNVKLNAASLNASTKQISQALGRITGQASEFQKSLDASTARVFAFGATTIILNGVTQAFRKLISTTIEVQKSLIEINSIFQATESTFNRFRTSIFQVAKDTGQSFDTVAKGAAELARQGLNAEETATRLKAALVLTRISGLDAEKSVKALTAAINGFASAGLNANQIVNKMVAVDTAFAVSAQDLADGFSRAGSTAEDAGVSFNELLALITAVEQRTARGGAVIGNAFKSIFTRLQRGTTIEKLQELGVAITATQGGVEKLKALSNAIERMSDPTVISQIKELAGGVFQINVVSAALKDLSNESGIFANAAKVAASATNEAFQKNEALSKSLAHNINELVVGLTSFAEKVGTITFGPLLEGLVGLANKFASFLDNALDPEKGNALILGFFKAIGAFLSGPLVIMFTAAFVKITKLVAKFAIGGLKSLFEMGTQAEKIRQIEGGIVGLLGRDAALRKVITSSTATQVQKEEAVILAIQRENALLQQQAAIMRSLAIAATARGVSGFGTGGFKGRKGKLFASGFQQEEAMATMLGAKNPKAHRSEGTIGGTHFTMNNREKEVVGFGKNGDSAVVPMGYAGGFIPNYAAPRGKPIKATPKKKAGDLSAKQAQQYLDYAQNKSKAASQFFKSRGDEGEWDWASKWMKDAKDITLKVGNPPRKKKFPIKSALDERKKQYLSKRTYFGNQKPKSVMLIPEKMAFEKNLADHRFDKPHQSKKGQGMLDFFEGGMAGINPDLKKGGPKQKRFVALLNLDEIMENNLAKGANYAVDEVGQAVGFSLDPEQISVEGFKAQLEKGGKGAFGAIKGAIFEVIMTSIAGGVSQDAKGRRGGQLDVDFRKDKGNILDDIFGVSGMEYGDFKSSSSIGNKGKYARQIVDNVKGVVESAADTKPPKHKIKNTKLRAAGFIPNFARGGLGAAIEREKNAGVPTNKIRAHFDENGMPIAVTNTDHERNGLKDVRRAAGGFIPNYHADFGMGAATNLKNFDPSRAERVGATGAAAPNANLGKLQNAANKTATALGKSNEALGKMQTSGMGLFMVFGVLQTSLGSVMAMNEKRIATAQTLSEKEIDKIEASDKDYFTKQRLIKQQEVLIQTMKDQPPALVRLADAAMAAATALFALSSLNMLTGGGMGRKIMGSKAGKGTAAFFGGRGALKAERAKAWGGKGLLDRGPASRANAVSRGKGAGMGSRIGRGGGALAVGLGAFDIYKTLSNKDLSKREKSQGVGGAAGGMAGALAGAKLGGMAGAFLAPVTGGLSIPIGALLGMIGGGIGGSILGEKAGGALSPEQKRLDLGEATAQASFFAGKGATNVLERETVGEVGFDRHEDVLPSVIKEPIMKKMGADIQANMGNVPFEALEGVVADAASDIQHWVDKKTAMEERYAKQDKVNRRVGGQGGGGRRGEVLAMRQKKLAQADRAILKNSDKLANARALQAGWNYKAHADQVAWEGRMREARSNLETATTQYAKSTFDLAQAQSKRITLATQQETGAKDQEFLVNALATGPNAMAAKTMAGINTGEASLEVLRQQKNVARDTLGSAPTDALYNTRNMDGFSYDPNVSNSISDERRLAMDAMIAPKTATADTTSKAFESAAFKFGVGLKKVAADINAAELANQTKIDNLLSQTITNMTTHVGQLFGQGIKGGIDAPMMEAQGTAMAGIAERAAVGTATVEELKRLGQMINEYDEGGMGMDAQELSSYFGVTAEEWGVAMKEVLDKAAVIGDDSGTFRARTKTDAEGKTTSIMEGVAEKMGYGTEELDELHKQEKALAGAMAVATAKWEKFADKGAETGVTAEKIEKMQKAINEGSEVADDIKTYLEGVLTASEAQTEFIVAQTAFADKSIKIMKGLTTRLEDLEGKVKGVRGDTDVTTTAVLGGDE